MKQKKYKYIYKSGHFIKKLYEADENQEQTANNQQETNKDTNAEDSSVNTGKGKSVQSNEEMQKLEKQIADLTLKYQQDVNLQNRLLTAAKKAAGDKVNTGIYDPVETDPDVLNVEKKLNDLEKKYNITMANLKDQKLALLTKLSSVSENYYNVPEKYKFLNESNIHTAKIYVSNLVNDDQILKGLVDFKRVFKNTNLLYGKDREGYFIVAIDPDDFNEATEALEEVGYLRDDILDTIMPQVLDRHAMIQ